MVDDELGEVTLKKEGDETQDVLEDLQVLYIQGHVLNLREHVFRKIFDLVHYLRY